MSYVTVYELCAIVTTSGPVLEHINGRRYWNFMELYNGSDGTEQLCIFLSVLLFTCLSVCLCVYLSLTNLKLSDHQ